MYSSEYRKRVESYDRMRNDQIKISQLIKKSSAMKKNIKNNRNTFSRSKGSLTLTHTREKSRLTSSNIDGSYIYKYTIFQLLRIQFFILSFPFRSNTLKNILGANKNENYMLAQDDYKRVISRYKSSRDSRESNPQNHNSISTLELYKHSFTGLQVQIFLLY